MLPSLRRLVLSLFCAIPMTIGAFQDANGYYVPLTDGDGQRFPAVLSPATWSVIGQIHPVSGTDGKVHLAYVLRFLNRSSAVLRVRDVQIIDPYRGNNPVGVNRILASKNEDVTGQLLPFLLPATLDAANYSRDLGAGLSAAIYLDVTFDSKAQVPNFISHRITVTQDSPTGEKSYVTIDQSVPIDRRDPIILSPPLRGPRWLNGNGCCREITPHRWVLSPINADFKPVEMFAIDFVQLRDDWRAYTGDVKSISSFPYYGVDVYNAGAGTVVEVVRDFPDEVPGANPPEFTATTAAGNHVIIDMGGGRYALYAHLAPYSPNVRVGQFVHKGAVIGKLGNSGNTDSPHLHFQVMDAPSSLGAHGLPFVFDHMRRGYVTTKSFSEESDEFIRGLPLSVAPTGNLQPLQNIMPLTFDVLDFP